MIRLQQAKRSLLAWCLIGTLGASLGCLATSPARARGPEGTRLVGSAVKLTAEWADQRDLTVGDRTRARLRISGDDVRHGVTVTATFAGARVVALPDACRRPQTVHTRSWITADRSQLICWVRRASGSDSLDVPVRADGADATATFTAAGAQDTRLGPRPIEAGGRDDPERSAMLRLVSAPDFLNADVADLRTGRADWKPSTSANSTNPDYETALDTVLGTWAALRPDLVLVAGDLVEGRWGRDDRRTGIFGPVDTPAHRRTAVRRAARTYYPAWSQRFREHHLRVFPAPGDHEYGDNDWGPPKLALTRTFRTEFAREFTRRPSGRPRFADRPRSTPHEFTAYAWRPRPEVQMVTLDVFDSSNSAMRVRLDRGQLRWLRQVLLTARKDKVRWIIVQGHTPIVGPVRVRSSSHLMYDGGRHSALWRTMHRFGVDLYLCGEVHDVTAINRDGVTQISHGGLFQFAMSNFLLADVRRDRIDLTLHDFDADARDRGPRLWETRRKGMPARLRYAPDPWIIGTAVLRGDGELVERSGALAAYRP